VISDTAHVSNTSKWTCGFQTTSHSQWYVWGEPG